MTLITIWEEFEKSAEMLYLRDPLNTRYSLKYSHSKGIVIVKITDNKKVKICLLKELLKFCHDYCYCDVFKPVIFYLCFTNLIIVFLC